MDLMTIWLRIRYYLGLTRQCPALYPHGKIRSGCQLREGHPGPHDDHWTRW